MKETKVKPDILGATIMGVILGVVFAECVLILSSFMITYANMYILGVGGGAGGVIFALCEYFDSKRK